MTLLKASKIGFSCGKAINAVVWRRLCRFATQGQVLVGRKCIRLKL